MLEQLFGGDAVTYSDATTLMDALAAYTVIVGWENMPEKLKESRENLIKYGKMDTSLIGEGTGNKNITELGLGNQTGTVNKNKLSKAEFAQSEEVVKLKGGILKGRHYQILLELMVI